MRPEILELRALFPGPSPSTLHHPDPNLSVDAPWGPPEEGGPSGPLPNDGGCEHHLESSVPYLDSKEASDLTSETSLSSDTTLVDDLIIGLRDCHPEIRPLQLLRSNL